MIEWGSERVDVWGERERLCLRVLHRVYESLLEDKSHLVLWRGRKRCWVEVASQRGREERGREQGGVRIEGRGGRRGRRGRKEGMREERREQGAHSGFPPEVHHLTWILVSSK